MPYPLVPLLDVTCPVNWADALNNGLVSWWMVVPASGWTGGNTFRDLVRGGKTPNDGALTNMAFPGTATSGWGPTSRPGGWGEVRFDGSDDLLDVGRCSATLEGVSAFTLALWVRPNSPGTLKSLAMKFNNGDTQTCFFIETGISDATKILYGVSTTTTDGNTYAETPTATITDATWTHIAMVFDGGQAGWSRVRIYANGVLQTPSLTNGTPPTVTPAATSSLRFGTISDGTSRAFTGSMDGAVMYNRALSAAEVAALYADSLTGYRRTLNWFEPGPWVIPSTVATAQYRVISGMGGGRYIAGPQFVF